MSAKKANCASAKIGGQWTTAERVWYRWIAAVQRDLAANHGRRGSASPRSARRRRNGRVGGPGRDKLRPTIRHRRRIRGRKGRPLAALRQNRGRCAVARTNSWLGEKTAAENERREC